ncbi:pilin [Moraxella lacunata]|uniref:pilin n=1 Tax=Moraxella lacunata TaxID=477 RepID=UPI003EE13C6B
MVGELASGKTAVDAALFDGKTPVLNEASNATKENIGLTTSPTTTTPRSNLLGATGIALNVNGSQVLLTGTLGRNANQDIHNATISQQRDANGNWSCIVAKASAGDAWKEKFTPSGCTHQAATPTL